MMIPSYIYLGWFCLSGNAAVKLEAELIKIVNHSTDMCSSLNKCLSLFKQQEEVSLSFSCQGVLSGSVVKCLTCYPGVLGSSRTGSSGFFRGRVLGQDTSEPQPSTGETQERHV